MVDLRSRRVGMSMPGMVMVRVDSVGNLDCEFVRRVRIERLVGGMLKGLGTSCGVVSNVETVRMSGRRSLRLGVMPSRCAVWDWSL
jgi:hypothetical protein